jgi:hypothetical protein
MASTDNLGWGWRFLLLAGFVVCTWLASVPVSLGPSYKYSQSGKCVMTQAAWHVLWGVTTPLGRALSTL